MYVVQDTHITPCSYGAEYSLFFFNWFFDGSINIHLFYVHLLYALIVLLYTYCKDSVAKHYINANCNVLIS